MNRRWVALGGGVAALAGVAVAVAASMRAPGGEPSRATPAVEVPTQIAEVTAAPSPPAVVFEYAVELLPEDVWPDRPPFAIERVIGPPPSPPATAAVSGPVRRMVIPRLHVDHFIEPLGVAPDNSLPTPRDASYRVGWYYDFGQPGEGGNAVFSAHETWNHYYAPFYYLHQAAPGDEITIEMTDGRVLRYSVTSNVRYAVEDLPMAEVLWPSTGGQESVTLITCGGRIVYDASGFGEYLDRDVVVALRIE